MISIYTLKHPITNEIRYVGKTKNNLSKRRLQHIIDANRKNRIKTYCANWINSLLEQGLRPIIELLDITDNNIESSELEKYWISQFRNWGFRLTNLTDGGEGAFGLTISNYAKYLKAKPVLQYSLNGEFIQEFKSMGDACKFLNIKTSSPIRIAINKKTTCRNYQWRDKEGSIIKNIGTKDFKGRSQRIDQYSISGEFIKAWNSANQAALYYNVWGGNIIRSCRSNLTCAGFIWRYYERKREILPINKNNYLPKSVVLEKDNIVLEFPSCRKASEYLNISYKLLHAILVGKIKNSRKLNGTRIKFK